MELKLKEHCPLEEEVGGSNRTFMELKCAMPVLSVGIVSSNRTFMELK